MAIHKTCPCLLGVSDDPTCFKGTVYPEIRIPLTNTKEDIVSLWFCVHKIKVNVT